MKYLVLILSLISGPAFGQSDDASIQTTLEKAATGFFKALQDENIEKCMDFFHPDAPNRARTKQEYESKFPTMELTYELSDFSYIGKDQKYAVARFVQKLGVIELNGKKIQDPRKGKLEMMMLFKRSGDSWKIWKSFEIERQIPQ